MPKKANLEDLAELRNRPGKMSCISELIWNSMQIYFRRMVMEVIKPLYRYFN